VIRLARVADAAAIDDICVRTGAAGQDARGRFSSDDLLPDVWARPYLALEPELAFVIDPGSGAIGYLLATADTAAFVEHYREHWLPGFAARWADDDDPRDAEPVRAGLEPERMLVPELDGYPAHLHIDLLPEAQGRGWGRALIDHLVAHLRARGVPGVHLGVDPANTGAVAFYGRLGFDPLPSGVLGLSLN
jgi:ribosomal protein S18 acetylase RimI-like enzyme